MYDPIKDVIASNSTSTTSPIAAPPPTSQLNVVTTSSSSSTSTSHRHPPLPPLPPLSHRHHNQQSLSSSSSDTYSNDRHRPPRDLAARSPPPILAPPRDYSYRLPSTYDSVRSGGPPRPNDLSRFSMDRYPLHGQPLQTQPPPPPPLSSSSTSLEYSSRGPYSHHHPGQYHSHSQSSHLSGHPLPPGPPPPPLSSYRPQSRDGLPSGRHSPPSSGSSPTVNHGHDGGQNGGSMAGVKPTLKRNQACLQCRRRKLKCDAARPHCKTCVRSFNHALRGAEASRRERIRERQRERGEEERDDNDDNDEEPPAESLIPPLSCTYEDPTEIQAKRQESAALTQKRYGQQIGAARILVEGLAGGSGLVRVDSSGDENWGVPGTGGGGGGSVQPGPGGSGGGGGGDGASRHPGSRKRSVGSLMGRNPMSPEYERAGKRREISQSHEQQPSHLYGSEARRDEMDPGGSSSYMSPRSAREPSSSYHRRSSPGSARRPPGSDNGYPPSSGYPHYHPSQPPPLSSNPSSAAVPYPYTPGPGPSPGQVSMKPNPWSDHGLPASGIARGYDSHPSSYDRGLDTPQDGMLGFPQGNPAYIHPGLHPLPPLDSGGPTRRGAPPFPEPLLPPTSAYGPPESSARESLRRESMHAPSSLNGPLGEMNGGPHGLPPHPAESTSSLRSSGFPLMNGSSHPSQHHGSSRTPSMNGHHHETGRSNGDFRDEPVWGNRGLIAGMPVRKTPTPGAEENGQLRSKIAWLESELRQAQDRTIVDPSLAAMDMARTPSGPGEAGASNRSPATGQAEDGNMLALLSQAIDQTGYQPVPTKPTSTSTGSSRRSGGSVGIRKETATLTHPGSTTPLEPKNIFEIAPAESWEATMASSRARKLANILNDAPSAELPTELKTYPLDLPETDLPKNSPSQIEAEPVLWDLLWPGWHKDLPNPELMDHICEVFFHHVPTVTRLFHYDTFKARMALPATHKDFPNVAVLHGICAAAARYTARVFTCNPEDEPWLRACQHMDEPIREEDFGIRHSLLAWNAVNRQLANGTNIYECAQTCILLANHHHMYARWAEGWVAIGLAGRLMAPLGLSLRERPAGGPGPAGRGPLLRPAANDIEREERRALFWAAVLYDAQISASAGWSGTIQFDEIFVPMPASLEAFEAGATKGIPESEQTLFSPDLYTHHPARDGFSLHVKAISLFHRVNKFVRLAKAKRSIGGAELDFRVTKDFQSLDETIQDFLLTFPSELRDPLTPAQGRIKKPIDVDLFTSQVLIHQMTIFLHEPFANVKNSDDPSTCRILEAARGVLKMIFAVTSTCLDLSLIVRADFGLHCAARTLVLFLRNAIETGDTSAGTEEQLRSEIEVFRLAFIAHGKRFPIGLRHSKVLDALLGDCGQRSRQDGDVATLKICDTPTIDVQDKEDEEDADASASDDSIDQAEADDLSINREVKQLTDHDMSPVVSKGLLPNATINNKHETLVVKKEQSLSNGVELEVQRTAFSNDMKPLDVVMS